MPKAETFYIIIYRYQFSIYLFKAQFRRRTFAASNIFAFDVELYFSGKLIKVLHIKLK